MCKYLSKDFHVCTYKPGTAICLPSKFSKPCPYPEAHGTLTFDNTNPEKTDKDKPIMSLVPGIFRTLLAEHMTAAQIKYPRDGWKSWENGEARCLDAMDRHSMAIMDGELFDPELGTEHYIAVAWNAMAAMWFRQNKPGESEGHLPYKD